MTTAFLLAVMLTGQASSPAAPSESTSRAAEALTLTIAAAKAYRFELTGDEAVDLEFQPGSILRWSNPAAGEVFGSVFVWTREGWEWQYAFARMNSVQFVAKHQDHEVWRVDIWPWSKTQNGIEPYTQFGPFQRPSSTQ